MRRSLAGSLLVAGVILGSGACAAQQEATPSATALRSDLQNRLQQVLDTAREDFGFAGVVAGVWSPDGAWIGSAGTDGAMSTQPITPRHHTRIGSVTKTFTVTLLLQEADKGTLSLSDPIEKYVPGLPNGTVATLRDLAQMTSGIPSYTESRDWAMDFFTDPVRSFTAEELLDYVRGTPALFAPGTQFHYSNSNTVALGLAIEKATGRPFGEVLDAQILTPLGMSETSWPGRSAAIPMPYLSGQTTQGLPEDTVKDATPWNPSWANAAGEMISTLEDLRVWGTALGTGEGILSAQSQQLRIASLDENLSIAGNTSDAVYGLGVGRIDGWIGHTGELPGYNTSVVYEQQRRTTVVVIVNSDIADAAGSNPAPETVRRIQDVLNSVWSASGASSS